MHQTETYDWKGATAHEPSLPLEQDWTGKEKEKTDLVQNLQISGPNQKISSLWLRLSRTEEMQKYPIYIYFLLYGAKK